MDKIQTAIACIISAAAGTAILYTDTGSSWLGRVVMCYVLVIMFAFIGYYSKYTAEMRINSGAARFMVELTDYTIESLEELIHNVEIDGSLSDLKRKEQVAVYRNCIEMIELYDELPPVKAIDEAINNCWYMAVVSALLLLVNIAWINETFSSISTLILMVIYITILIRSIVILRGKNNGKGKKDICK